MKTDCPRDGHGRTLITATRRLTCADKKCQCAECHRQLTEAEAKVWRSE